jgi:NAD+ kinase
VSGVRVHEVEACDDALVEVLKRCGIEVRRGAPVVAVYGRDRDILKALREEDRPVLGISPPGVSARLAALELRELPRLPELEFRAIGAIRLEAESGGQKIRAINEIALLPAEPATFVRYSLFVDGEFVFNDLGDGCLVSTPVGSTAYALAAGGASIDPRAEVLEVVPLNSALRRPPHIFPSSATLELRNVRSAAEVYVIGDSVERTKYRGGAVIRQCGKARFLVKAAAPPAYIKLPPSALLVKKILDERGPLTVSEVAALTGLSPRTARHALERLRRAGLVRAAVDPTDPRRRIYMSV